MKSRILITDDNVEMRMLVRLSLESDDIELFEADSGKSGLETAKHVKPHLVLMDVMMPGEFDGLQACRRIKDVPELADTFVIILSACGQESDIASGTKAGADGYIVKPFSPMRLRETVSMILSHHV